MPRLTRLSRLRRWLACSLGLLLHWILRSAASPTCTQVAWEGLARQTSGEAAAAAASVSYSLPPSDPSLPFCLTSLPENLPAGTAEIVGRQDSIFDLSLKHVAFIKIPLGTTLVMSNVTLLDVPMLPRDSKYFSLLHDYYSRDNGGTLVIRDSVIETICASVQWWSTPQEGSSAELDESVHITSVYLSSWTALRVELINVLIRCDPGAPPEPPDVEVEIDIYTGYDYRHATHLASALKLPFACLFQANISLAAVPLMDEAVLHRDFLLKTAPALFATGVYVFIDWGYNYHPLQVLARAQVKYENKHCVNMNAVYAAGPTRDQIQVKRAVAAISARPEESFMACYGPEAHNASGGAAELAMPDLGNYAEVDSHGCIFVYGGFDPRYYLVAALSQNLSLSSGCGATPTWWDELEHPTVAWGLSPVPATDRRRVLSHVQISGRKPGDTIAVDVAGAGPEGFKFPELDESVHITSVYLSSRTACDWNDQLLIRFDPSSPRATMLDGQPIVAAVSLMDQRAASGLSLKNCTSLVL
eukprot:gene7280-396_t